MSLHLSEIEKFSTNDYNCCENLNLFMDDYPNYCPIFANENIPSYSDHNNLNVIKEYTYLNLNKFDFMDIDKDTLKEINFMIQKRIPNLDTLKEKDKFEDKKIIIEPSYSHNVHKNNELLPIAFNSIKELKECSKNEWRKFKDLYTPFSITIKLTEDITEEAIITDIMIKNNSVSIITLYDNRIYKTLGKLLSRLKRMYNIHGSLNPYRCCYYKSQSGNTFPLIYLVNEKSKKYYSLPFSLGYKRLKFKYYFYAPLIKYYPKKNKD